MRMCNLIHYIETPYGFEYGNARVERFHSDEEDGSVIIGIGTDKYSHPIQIYVTRTGKVRIFSVSGEWVLQEK